MKRCEMKHTELERDYVCGCCNKVYDNWDDAHNCKCIKKEKQAA